MDKIIVEKEVGVPVPVESGGGTASSAIWAVAFIVIIGMIVGALYYSGALRRLTTPQQPQKINVDVSAPAMSVGALRPRARVFLAYPRPHGWNGIPQVGGRPRVP